MAEVKWIKILTDLFEDEKIIVCAKEDAQRMIHQQENEEVRSLIEQIQLNYHRELS